MDKLASQLKADIEKVAAYKLTNADLEELIASRKGSLPGSFIDYLLPNDETRIQDQIHNPLFGAATGGLGLGSLGVIGGASAGVGGGPRTMLALGGLGGLVGGGLGALLGYLGQRDKNAELASILRYIGDPEATLFDAEGVGPHRNRLDRRQSQNSANAIASAIASK